MSLIGRMRCVLLFAITVAIPVTPAFAQVDLTGEWRALVHEDVNHRADDPTVTPGIRGAEGSRIGDYTGLPLNDAARRRADSWDPRIWNVREHQTVVHPAAYWALSPGGLRISKTVDPVSQRIVSYTIFRAAAPGYTTRTVWMDGRQPPPAYAAHLWQGFSTGRWVGDMLAVQTTHLKEGWVRRNGVPASDRATVTEYFVRHDSVLTLIAIVTDPVYLTEPIVETVSWMLNLRQQIPPRPYTVIADEIPGQPKTFVPHYLPGQNPFLHEFSQAFGIPYEATRGGADTMYPEYQQRLKTMNATARRR